MDALSKRIAIITTHPIQYNVPWMLLFKHHGINLKVFYTLEQASLGEVKDVEFNKKIIWDLPLLEGYEYKFVKNISPNPGTSNFFGIINPSLINEVSSWNPDFILIIGWNYYSHYKCLKFFRGKIPIFFKGDSILKPQQNLFTKILKYYFLKNLFKSVTYALYASNKGKEYFLNFGLKEHQLKFTPNSIDIDRFSLNDGYEKEISRIKTELKIPNDHLTILFAGKISKVKNPYFIIKLSDVCKKLKVTFIIVGSGPLLGKMLESSKNNTYVKFLDFQNQTIMPLIYRLGDIYIMPSYSETWGMGINEAMACGRPIMASDQVVAAMDLVKENVNGIIFNPNDTNKCKEFIETCLLNPSILKTMGDNSRIIIKDFSLSRTVDSIVELIYKV